MIREDATVQLFKLTNFVREDSSIRSVRDLGIGGAAVALAGVIIKSTDWKIRSK